MSKNGMSKFVDRPRFTCALGGALTTLRALPRAIPIIHASAGCGGNLYNASNPGAGYLGGGYCGGTAWSSSNVVEREIVFGGESRLEEQIRSTLELIDGDLFVVVTGCMVEMIGDDVTAVVGEFADSEPPVLAVPTPSFKGSSYDGYDMLLEGLFENYVKQGIPQREDTVNLLGIVPGQDAFYKGNLTEIRRLLERLGLRVNTFFGEGETLKNLQNAAEASLNIVLSDVYGVKAAEAFEKIHGVRYVSLPLPVGAAQTSRFLRDAAKALSLGDKDEKREKRLEQTIQEEEARYYDYFERITDIYNDVDLQRYAVVVGDLNYAPMVSRFVADELGWLPRLTVITDDLQEDQARTVETRFTNWESGVRPLVKFDTDTSSIQRYFPEMWEPSANQRYYDSFSPAYLIGSVFERDLAAKLGIPLLTVSFPVTNRIVLNQCYAGYNGGLGLTADLLGTLIAGR
jgi:nitrogenase molybdenum-iron protein beta chain